MLPEFSKTELIGLKKMFEANNIRKKLFGKFNLK